jgi:hypothetical protein
LRSPVLAESSASFRCQLLCKLLVGRAENPEQPVWVDWRYGDSQAANK